MDAWRMFGKCTTVFLLHQTRNVALLGNFALISQGNQLMTQGTELLAKVRLHGNTGAGLRQRLREVCERSTTGTISGGLTKKEQNDMADGTSLV